MPSSADLLDANVWLAPVAEAHTHHERARRKEPEQEQTEKEISVSCFLLLKSLGGLAMGL